MLTCIKLTSFDQWSHRWEVINNTKIILLKHVICMLDYLYKYVTAKICKKLHKQEVWNTSFHDNVKVHSDWVLMSYGHLSLSIRGINMKRSSIRQHVSDSDDESLANITRRTKKGCKSKRGCKILESVTPNYEVIYFIYL